MPTNSLPTGLLRSPGGALGEQLDQPIVDQLRTRNRYRSPTTSVTINDMDVVPLLSEDQAALEVFRSATTDTGRASVVGLADSEPDVDAAPGMQVAINGRRVFEGRVTSASITGAGVLTATAHDPKRAINSSTFSGSYEDASVGTVMRDVLRSVPVPGNIRNRYFSISEIEQGGQPIERGYQRIVDEEGQDVDSGEQTAASGQESPTDADRQYPTLTRDYTDRATMRVIEDLAARSGAHWWVDADYTVHFAHALPSNGWWVNGVLESKAGESRPPVRKIVVVGGPKGPANDRRKPRASKDRYRAVAGNEDAPASQTYRHDERSATTQNMTDALAQSLWREQQRRTANGTIRLSGRAAVEPLDRIGLPPYIDDKDKRYAVRSVRHRITSDEGYVTMVTLGGKDDNAVLQQRQTDSEQASGATGWGDGATQDEGQAYPDLPGGGAH